MVKSKVVSLTLAAVIFVIGIACGLILDKVLVCRRGGFHASFRDKAMNKKDLAKAILPRLGKALELTAEQKEKIHAVLKEQKRETDKLMGPMHAKIEDQMNVFRGKIRDLLDEKQKNKFDKFVEKQKQRSNKFKEKKEQKEN
ncbi:MAG: hypothetical protein ABII74_03885 [Elusimicrobiota bacterium]